MYAFESDTADELWLQAAKELHLKPQAELQQSRAGATSELLHVNLTLSDPRQRWVISREPAISVAFAIVEVIGIMAGRRDAGFLNNWNRDLPRFAGSGNTYHGAYGYRLRVNFGLDQLQRAYLALKHNQNSRQVVLQIWDSRIDFPTETGEPSAEDIPCNVCSLLKIRNGRLEWLQIMRSNDLFKGLPYNFVQFTSLQEILAGWLGLDLGEYNHISDSLHLYQGDFAAAAVCASTATKFKNGDSLQLPKDKSDIVWAEMERRATELGNNSTGLERICELSSDEALPSAYNNLLAVLAAEAARRRKDAELGVRIMKQCTNPLLSDLWLRWMTRKRKEAENRSRRITESQSA